MNFYKIICCLAITTVGVATHANSSFDTTTYTNRLLTTVTLGPVWGKTRHTQTLELAPDIIKTYSPEKKAKAIGYGEFFVGVFNNFPKDLQTQIGLAIATTTEAVLSGEIWEDGLPEFNNFKYKYKLQHSHLALKGKLLLDKKYALTPWVSGSLGIGLNHTRFSNIPLVDGAITMPDFKKDTTTTLTYSLGAGVQYKLDQKMQIGIGYEFADWGKSKLKPSSAQATSAKLSLSHFYTHGMLANFTYFI